MPTRRQRRVSDQIREVISELIVTEVEDPRLAGLTVMDVVIDRELEVANVFVNALQGDAVREKVIAALSGATRFIRKELGSRLKLRHTPELRFHWDESLAEADKIEALLGSIRQSRPNDTMSSGNESN